MLILICLRVTLFQAILGVPIEDLTPLPNLLFDDLSDTRIFHKEWKLVTYLELEIYPFMESQLRLSISQLRNLCDECGGSKTLSNMLKQINRISKDRKRLYSSIGYSSSKHKRGIFDFVGEISKNSFWNHECVRCGIL